MNTHPHPQTCSLKHVLARWAPFTSGRFDRLVTEMVFGAIWEIVLPVKNTDTGTDPHGVAGENIDADTTICSEWVIEILAPGSLHQLLPTFTVDREARVDDIYNVVRQRVPRFRKTHVRLHSVDDIEFVHALYATDRIESIPSTVTNQAPFTKTFVAIPVPLSWRKNVKTHWSRGMDVCDLKWHPTHNLLAIRPVAGHSIQVWDVDSNKLVYSKKFTLGSRMGFAFYWSPDGSRMAVMATTHPFKNTKCVRVYDTTLTSCELCAEFTVDFPSSSRSSNSVWDHTSSFLATIHNGDVCVWNVATGTIQSRFFCRQEPAIHKCWVAPSQTRGRGHDHVLDDFVGSIYPPSPDMVGYY